MKKTILLITALLFALNLFSQTEVFPFKKDEKWGIINAKKKVLMEPTFNFPISFFMYSEGKFPIAKFKKDSLFGLINKKGKILVNPDYQTIINKTNRYIFLKNDNFTSIFNKQLEKIVLKNINTNKAKINIRYIFNDEIFVSSKDFVKKYNARGKLIFKRKNKFYKSQNLTTTKSNYSSGANILNAKSPSNASSKNLSKFKESYPELKIISTIVGVNKSIPTLSIIRNKEKYGVINKDFKFILEPKYDIIDYINRNQCVIVKKNTLYGIFDFKERKFSIPLKYKLINKLPLKPEYIGSYKIHRHNYLFIDDGKNSGYINIDTDQIYIPN